MTQFFLLLKECSTAFVYIHAWRFSDKRIEKSYDAIFLGIISKIKQQDTRVNYNKGSETQSWAEKRLKQKKTKKARRQI